MVRGGPSSLVNHGQRGGKVLGDIRVDLGRETFLDQFVRPLLKLASSNRL